MIALDHVGIAYRNLAFGKRQFERLGFRLTPRSLHRGRLSPDGPIVQWGSGNHCAMFRQGYLEVLGLIDRNAPSSIRNRIDRYEGAHIVALSCPNIVDFYASHRMALPCLRPPIYLTRRVQLNDNRGPTLVAFHNCYVDPELYPEARLLFIEHLTPELLWDNDWLEHPNRATRLLSVGLNVSDITAAIVRYEQLLSFSSKRTTSSHAVCFQLPRGGSLFLYDSTTLGADFVMFPGSEPPSVVSAAFATDDLDACATILSKNGVPFHADTNNVLRLSDVKSIGCNIAFVDESDLSRGRQISNVQFNG